MNTTPHRRNRHRHRGGGGTGTPSGATPPATVAAAGTPGGGGGGGPMAGARGPRRRHPRSPTPGATSLVRRPRDPDRRRAPARVPSAPGCRRPGSGDPGTVARSRPARNQAARAPAVTARATHRPAALGQEETVTVEDSDRSISVTSPDRKGQVKVTVDNGSGRRRPTRWTSATGIDAGCRRGLRRAVRPGDARGVRARRTARRRTSGGRVRISRSSRQGRQVRNPGRRPHDHRRAPQGFAGHDHVTATTAPQADHVQHGFLRRQQPRHRAGSARTARAQPASFGRADQSAAPSATTPAGPGQYAPAGRGGQRASRADRRTRRRRHRAEGTGDSQRPVAVGASEHRPWPDRGPAPTSPSNRQPSYSADERAVELSTTPAVGSSASIEPPPTTSARSASRTGSVRRHAVAGAWRGRAVHRDDGTNGTGGADSDAGNQSGVGTHAGAGMTGMPMMGGAGGAGGGDQDPPPARSGAPPVTCSTRTSTPNWRCVRRRPVEAKGIHECAGQGREGRGKDGTVRREMASGARCVPATARRPRGCAEGLLQQGPVARSREAPCVSSADAAWQAGRVGDREDRAGQELRPRLGE